MGAHLLLYGSVLIIGMLFVLYVFSYDHKQGIDDNQVWVEAFKNVGIDPKNMTHDDSTWYYKQRSTCVGYGDWEEVCPKYENYCAANKVFGTPLQQARAIKEALINGGTHKECPIIYAGAN